MNVFHVITGLNDGGAEAVLYGLCSHDQSNQHTVISLSGPGKYASKLKSLGVPVTTLNMSPDHSSLFKFISLVLLFVRDKPDVVQTWMYHGDLVGGLAARMAGIKSVIWGIHNSTLKPGISKKTTIFIVNILAKLSSWIPARIAVCAQRSIEVHQALGYDRDKMCFIPNGYDLSKFKRGLDFQSKLRLNLVSNQSIPLIGMVARFDPQKDHVNLLDALAILSRGGLAFRCVLVGTGLDSSNPQIIELISRRNLVGHLQLLGRRSDVPRIMNALDLHVLPSAYGEAFPNVVAEAMACGTPCVVTDVGDAAYIVGDVGWVVPPQDPIALAQAISTAIHELNTEDGEKRGYLSRLRIEENFSIEQMIGRYNCLWRQAAHL
jgi:glycosyltransferase involved in cell wall biosynthesis